ncbi:MAG: ParB/RepB/Spo0J family partition protein [Patescibacteria group bacterium]
MIIYISNMGGKTSLGRGLGALIPQRQSITEQIIPEAQSVVIEIPIGSLQVNPRQPREHFSAGDMEDLISSIKEHGILQPLIVTKEGTGYELIAGERRFRASKTLGLKTVPVIVRKASEQQKLELALIENIQRENLNPAEEALAYKALVDEFNLRLDEVSVRVGKSVSAVSNMIRLNDLPEKMFKALRNGEISKSHARSLLSEPDPKKQDELFKAILKGGMTVREVEARTTGLHKKRKVSESKDPNIADHEKKLREIFGTKVDIQEKKGKGKITIEFYSKEEFFDLLDRLSG